MELTKSKLLKWRGEATQEDFARYLGYNRTYYIAIEKGHEPIPRKLEKRYFAEGNK